MRRAEAIMSAIGATEWYSQIPRAHHEENLVMGKYPLAFVREMQRASPGQFFGALHRTRSETVSYEDEKDFKTAWEILRETNKPVEYAQAIYSLQVTGSLLPFGQSRRGADFQDTIECIEDATFCESLGNWEVQLSGHVTIMTATVLASQTVPAQEAKVPMPCKFTGQMQSKNVPSLDGRVFEFPDPNPDQPGKDSRRDMT